MNLKNIAKKNIQIDKVLAQTLGYFGLIPFILGTLLIIFSLSSYKVLELIIIYAYTISAFLGGIYWGIGLFIQNKSKRYYITSIIPSVLILVSLFFELEKASKIIFLIAVFNLFLLLELSFLKDELIPKWFFLLRIKLNIILTFLLLVIMINFL